LSYANIFFQINTNGNDNTGGMHFYIEVASMKNQLIFGSVIFKLHTSAMHTMENLSPNLFVKDINETIEFYEQLGFQVITTVPEKGEFIWAMMSCNKVTFMFQTFDSLDKDLPAISRGGGGSLLFYIGIKNIRDFFEGLKEKVTIVKGLNKTFYGATEFSILDNNGFVLTFAEDE
jgi:uncharacterized glyoxalase superfamily protein PhnB